MKAPEITHYTVTSGKLPNSFDGFKIAHISDMHSRPCEGIADAVASENPDITVITGDMLHDDSLHYNGFKRLLDELLSISPVYAVTGNHDLWRSGHNAVFSELRKKGLIILEDECIELCKNGEKIALFGINDPFSKLPSLINKNLCESFSQLPEFDGYKILLFHRANLFDDIKGKGFDLILSGHMHGGQVRIPHLGGVLAPSSAIASGKSMLFPKYTAGRYDFENSVMIVNRGSSNTLPIPRFGNPPEVGIITVCTKISEK